MENEKIKYVKVESPHENSERVMIMITADEYKLTSPFLNSVAVFHALPTQTQLHKAIDSFLKTINE